MDKYTNRELWIMLQQIQDRFKKVEDKIEIFGEHVIRCSRDMTYIQGVVEKICKENDEEYKKQSNENKNKVDQLTKLLIKILIAICVLALGINNIPEAVNKLMSLL